MVWFMLISAISVPKIVGGGPRVLKGFPGVFIYIFAKKNSKKKIGGPKLLVKNKVTFNYPNYLFF